MKKMASFAPDLLEHRPCPVCDRDDGEVIFYAPPYFYDHARFETASWDGRQAVELRIIRCACGLARTDPAFKPEHLDLVYPEDLVPNASDAKQLDKIFDLKNPKFNAMAQHVRRFLPSGATVVDIGTRYGVFPWIAEKRYGLKALGLELNAAAVQLGKLRFEGIEQGSAVNAREVLARHSVQKVDGFVLDDVLEHLTHPGRDLDALAQLLPAGGYLFLRQMDCASLGAKLFRNRWYYIAPAAHTFYFNEGSIKALLNRHGFSLIEVKRAPLLVNALKTAWSLPLSLWRGHAARRSNGKRSYLTQRLRASDDMTLVTARKRD
ncbi:MAG: class I SAM-dependent methyltransferase [Myxococcota bacterium]|jgi:hypothetical protein|nr:class I SAM-dependent methyltransferase [Myxococcota bacterium]